MEVPIGAFRSTLVLYRQPKNAAVLTTLASAGVRGGPLHAHGPALIGDVGDETAETIEKVAAGHGVTAMVWDGDVPTDVDGVSRLAHEVTARLLVVEWQPAVGGGDARSFTAGDVLARRLLDDPPCDVLLIRPGELAEIGEIVVAVGPGPNAPLVADLARAWAAAFEVPARLLHRVETDDDVGEGRRLCKALAPELPATVAVGRDLTNLLTEAAARSGFLAMGATEMVAVDRVAARTRSALLAGRGDATIIIGRTRPDDRTP